MKPSPNHYQPGVCNIGDQELSVRWKFIRFFLPVTILLTIGSFYWWDSLWVWFFLLCASFSLIVLYLEVRTRFCILFGFFNLHNFEQLGELKEVKNAEHAKLDRRRVFQICLKAMAASLLYSSVVHMLATHLGLHH